MTHTTNLVYIFRTWWWDSWVEPNNLYHIFKPFSEFVSRLQLAEYTWTAVDPKTSPSELRAWGMAGKGEGKELVLTWIQDDCYTWTHQTSGDKCQQWSNGVVVITECSAESGNIVGIGRWDFGERLFLFTLHPHFSPSLLHPPFT